MTAPSKRMVWALYLAALALLVLNDHVLKYGGRVPPWLSGKLSDFCGLVVAPIALALLLRARSQRGRLQCFAAVALPFVAINLSDASSRAVERLTAMTPLPWQLWPDAADLVALVVAPLALWMVAVLVPRRDRDSGAGSALGARLAAIAGGLGCLASGLTHDASVYLVNDTDKEITVEYSLLRGRAYPSDLECERLFNLDEGVLRQDDFEIEGHYSVRPHGVMPLTCVSRIATSGIIRAIAVDPELAGRELTDEPDSDELENTRALVFLRLRSGEPELRPGKGTRVIELAPEGAPLPAVECEQTSIPKIELSEAGTLDNAFAETITAKRPTQDGCFTLELERAAALAAPSCPDGGLLAPAASDDDAGVEADDACGAWREAQATTRRLYACMPEELFPFEVGTAIRVKHRGTHWTIDREGGPERVRLVVGVYGPQSDPFVLPWDPLLDDDAPIPPGPEVSLQPSSCGVIRSACGALIEPQDILFGTRRVRPGEVFEDGSVTYYFSRAMHVLVGRLDCEAGAQTTSSYVEWLEVHRDDR